MTAALSYNTTPNTTRAMLPMVGVLLAVASTTADSACSAHQACERETPCVGLIGRSNQPGSSKDVLDTAMGAAWREDMRTFSRAFANAMAVSSHKERNLRLLALRSSSRMWRLPTYNMSGGCELGDFLNFKSPILKALEESMGLGEELWQPGKSLLDVGGALGLLDAYLAAVHDVHIAVYEIPYTATCLDILHSPFRINFFSGKLQVPHRSYDAVSFVSVLHHAAKHTVPLLRDAAGIARRFILILEDLHTGYPPVSKRNREHDPHGIFRTDAAWKQLFMDELPGFTLRTSGRLHLRRPCVDGTRAPDFPAQYRSVFATSKKHGISLVCSDDSKTYPNLVYYVLERKTSEAHLSERAAKHAARESGRDGHLHSQEV